MRIRPASLVLLAVLGTAATAWAEAVPPPTAGSPYWHDSRRGWHFYEARPARPEPLPAPPAPEEPAEVRDFARLQQRLERARTIAIMRPTEANVRRYMTLESDIVAQASRFADVAQRIAWTTPALDPTLQGRPVGAKALEVFEQEQAQARAQQVAALRPDHALFFFFRSDCPYCHALAPVLRAFQARHGLTIVPVSLDGGSLADFPQPRRDNGIARALQVEQVPALYLAQPATGHIIPIGFGLLSESQLLERIARLAALPPQPDLAGLARPRLP